MTAPTYFVFDGDSGSGVIPRVPSLDDLGGASYVNDATYPPTSGDPNADDFNQQQRVLAALARLSEVAAVEILFNATPAPTLSGLWAANSTLAAAGISLVAGASNSYVDIQFPRNSLPTAARLPVVSNHANFNGWRGASATRGASYDTIRVYPQSAPVAGERITVRIFGVS